MQNKITIKEATKQISEGFSSIYSKDDVLHLLSVIEVEDADIEFSEDAIRDLSADIANELSDAGTDLIDDYELSMSYREVELDSISFSTNDVQNIVENAITHYIKTNKADA
jgi:hypothetical protein